MEDSISKMKTDRILPPQEIIEHVGDFLDWSVEIVYILAAIPDIGLKNARKMGKALNLRIVQDEVFIVPYKIVLEGIRVGRKGNDEDQKANAGDLFSVGGIYGCSFHIVIKYNIKGSSFKAARCYRVSFVIIFKL